MAPKRQLCRAARVQAQEIAHSAEEFFNGRRVDHVHHVYHEEESGNIEAGLQRSWRLKPFVLLLLAYTVKLNAEKTAGEVQVWRLLVKSQNAELSTFFCGVHRLHQTC